MGLFETHKLLDWVAIFFFFNLSLLVLETLLDLATQQNRTWWDTASNAVIFILGQLTEKFLFGSLSVLGLLPIYLFVPWTIPMEWWTWVMGLLAADFTYYWMHRLEHEHRILWASHSVHHSSQDYNLSVSLRLSIVEGLFEWAFLIPMVLIGFNPFQAVISLVFVVQYQTWIHTEHIQKLGWLDEVFNTPSVHRVHHGSNKKYLDKNYGGVLMVWDKLFGTFQREEEKVVYGLTKNINTHNPFTINFIEYHNIWLDVKQCRSLKDQAKIVLGDLNWRPSYFEQQEKNN